MRNHRQAKRERDKAGARIAQLRSTLLNWDRIRETKDCPHCQGTGIAPGDGRTKCGFCVDKLDGRQ